MSGSGKLAVQVKGVRLDRTHLHLADVEAFWPAMGHAINFVRPLTQTTKLTNARILLRSYALAVSNKNPSTTAVAKPFRATQAHQDLSVTF